MQWLQPGISQELCCQRPDPVLWLPQPLLILPNPTSPSQQGSRTLCPGRKHLHLPCHGLASKPLLFPGIWSPMCGAYLQRKCLHGVFFHIVGEHPQESFLFSVCIHSLGSKAQGEQVGLIPTKRKCTGWISPPVPSLSQGSGSSLALVRVELSLCFVFQSRALRCLARTSPRRDGPLEPLKRHAEHGSAQESAGHKAQRMHKSKQDPALTSP